MNIFTLYTEYIFAGLVIAYLVNIMLFEITQHQVNVSLNQEVCVFGEGHWQVAPLWLEGCL